MPDVYEIKITGDASALTVAAKQAEAALAQVGKAAATGATRPLAEMGTQVGNLRLGFRDTTSAARIFIHSLASEFNPTVNAAITQARMMSFALLNFRNVLGPGFIAGLAIAAGAIELFTSRAQRLADIQLKANRAMREFDAAPMITGIREASFELEKLDKHYWTSLTKFTGYGGLGGLVSGAITGGLFGAKLGLPGGLPGVAIASGVGALLGVAGGAGLFKLMTGMSKSEFEDQIRDYDKALGTILERQRTATDAIMKAITARREMARLQSLAEQRGITGMPPEVSLLFETKGQTGIEGLVKTELLKAQLGERLALETEYAKKYEDAARLGQNMAIAVELEYAPKYLQMDTEHYNQRLALEGNYRQRLLKAIASREEAALHAEETARFTIPEFLREAQQQIGVGNVLEESRSRRGLERQWALDMAPYATGTQAAEFYTFMTELRQQAQRYGAAERVAERPGEMGVPLVEEGSIPDLMRRAEAVGRQLGEAEAEGVIKGLRDVSERNKDLDYLEGTVFGSLLGTARAKARADQLALDVAEARAKTGETIGEQFESGFTSGLIRLQQSIGTFGQQVGDLMQGLGNTWTRSLDDTFFNVLTGRFKSLPDVARQFGYAIVREFSGAIARAVTGGALQSVSSLTQAIGLGPLVGSLAAGGATGTTVGGVQAAAGTAATIASQQAAAG